MEKPEKAGQASREEGFEFETLFTPIKDKVLQYIYCKVPASDADDVFQETCLVASSNCHKLEDKSRFKTWMYTLARYRVADYFRARKKMAIIDHFPEDMPEIPDRGPSSFESLQLNELRRCILALRETYRNIAILRFIAGLDIREISRITGLSVNTVKTYIQRAKAMIIRQFDNN